MLSGRSGFTPASIEMLWGCENALSSKAMRSTAADSC